MILEGNKVDLEYFGCGHRPYPSSYSTELDVTDELYADLIKMYQQIIGVIRWSIELWRIDIMTELTFFSQYFC